MITDDPELCRRCNDREGIFSMPGHPDDGKVFQCGIKEENKRAGTLMFYCPYYRGVIEAIGDKVKCKTMGGTCMCQPNNNGGKGICGKAIILTQESPHAFIDPVIDGEARQRATVAKGKPIADIIEVP